MNLSGTIFNIQRFSIHDGPGIRTTVFFKGCPLHCFWCHNPEGIKMNPEIQFNPSRCIVCGSCLDKCKHFGHEIKEQIHIYLRENCIRCGDCLDTCYAETMEMVGKQMSVDEVMTDVLRDRPFYDTSGGGITLSGGEPLLQYEFAREILIRSKKEMLHTAVETIANCKWEDLNSLLPMIDLVMMDLKHLDDEKHKNVTGASNKTILDNARKLAEIDIQVLFRIPVVPTVNDTEKEIGDIVDFVLGLIETRKKITRSESNSCGIQLELLPFHKLASDKYRSLGFQYEATSLETISKSKMDSLKNIAKTIGIIVRK